MFFANDKRALSMQKRLSSSGQYERGLSQLDYPDSESKGAFTWNPLRSALYPQNRQCKLEANSMRIASVHMQRIGCELCSSKSYTALFLAFNDASNAHYEGILD